MPKSRKKKNADFQKVKLKVGKSLPRGGNETNVSFKSRTIKVAQNIRDSSKSSDEPQTKGKLTLEDLLKQCSANRSCSQRLAAVDGFRELLLCDQGHKMAAVHLGAIIARVAGLLSDPEHTVRQAILRLCNTAFAHPASGKHCRFDFNRLSAHLACAINHIADSVRRDALALFDLLLDKFPQKVICGFCRLVPTLLGHVANQMTEARAGSRVGALIVRPDSNLSLPTYRALMLQRLNKIVEAVIQRECVNRTPAFEPEVYHVGRPNTHITGTPVLAAVRSMWPQWPKPMPVLSDDNIHFFLPRDVDSLEKFFTTLLPLVRHCVKEMGHVGQATDVVHTSATAGGQLKEASVPVLHSVVSLLHSLARCWTLIRDAREPDPHKMAEFQERFVREVKETLLLPYFPFAVADKASRQQREPPAQLSPLQVSVLKVNLLLCETLAAFPVSLRWPEEDVPGESWHRTVATFLKKNLVTCKKADLMKYLLPVLRTVFYNFPPSDIQDKLLAKMQKRFIKAHHLSREKRHYLDFFFDLISDKKAWSPYLGGYKERHEKLRPFLEHLPVMLLELRGVAKNEEMVRRVVDVMAAFFFYSSLKCDIIDNHMEQILDVSSGVFVAYPPAHHEGLAMLVQTVYSQRPAREEVLKLMEAACRLPGLQAAHARRMLQALLSTIGRLWMDHKFLDSGKTYLSFALSILVGHRRVEMEEFHQANKWETGRLTRILWSGSTEAMAKHALLVETVVRFPESYMSHAPHADRARLGSETIEFFSGLLVNRILDRYCALSVHTAYGVLVQFTHFLSHLGIGDHVHFDCASHPDKSEACRVSDPEFQRMRNDRVSVVKATLRPFTKLAFSVLYSMVSMEMADEEISPAVPSLMESLLGAVVGLMRASLRALGDLCTVAANFVRDQGCEVEARKVAVGMTRVLAREELLSLLTHHGNAKEALDQLVAAVKAGTDGVESSQWWQDFVRTPWISFSLRNE